MLFDLQRLMSFRDLPSEVGRWVDSSKRQSVRLNLTTIPVHFIQKYSFVPWQGTLFAVQISKFDIRFKQIQTTLYSTV